jgi:hypothetical protein
LQAITGYELSGTSRWLCREVKTMIDEFRYGWEEEDSDEE